MQSLLVKMVSSVSEIIFLIKKCPHSPKYKDCRGFLSRNLPIDPCESQYRESLGQDFDFCIKITLLNRKMSRKAQFYRKLRIFVSESSYRDPVRVGMEVVLVQIVTLGPELLFRRKKCPENLKSKECRGFLTLNLPIGRCNFICDSQKKDMCKFNSISILC